MVRLIFPAIENIYTFECFIYKGDVHKLRKCPGGKISLSNLWTSPNFLDKTEKIKFFDKTFLYPGRRVEQLSWTDCKQEARKGKDLFKPRVGECYCYCYYILYSQLFLGYVIWILEFHWIAFTCWISCSYII